MITAVIVLSATTLVTVLTSVGALAFAYWSGQGARLHVEALKGRNAELGVAAVSLLQLLEQFGMGRVEFDGGGHLLLDCIPIMPNPEPLPGILRGQLANAVEYALRSANIELLGKQPEGSIELDAGDTVH